MWHCRIAGAGILCNVTVSCYATENEEEDLEIMVKCRPSHAHQWRSLQRLHYFNTKSNPNSNS